jgi:nucleoside-diphosphate-sugar epimerase
MTPSTVAVEGYAGRRVLLLGGTGFIGQWVARALCASGASLTVATRNTRAAAALLARRQLTASCAPLDVTSAGAVRQLLDDTRPQVVFNCAGYGVARDERDEATMWRLNAEWPRLLVEALAARVADGDDWKGQRLVHVGSGAEYGSQESVLREDTIPMPTSAYGRSKLAGTQQVIAHGSQMLAVRLFNVYGPGEQDGRLLPTLLAAAHHGTSVPLSQGLQRRDFTYVEDVAEGLLRLGLEPQIQGGLVQLGSGTLRTVREFVERAGAVIGITADRLDFGAVATRSLETEYTGVDITRLRTILGWSPATSIESGVRRSIDWIAAGHTA